jgi:hypothetical protein
MIGCDHDSQANLLPIVSCMVERHVRRNHKIGIVLRKGKHLKIIV